MVLVRFEDLIFLAISVRWEIRPKGLIYVASYMNLGALQI